MKVLIDILIRNMEMNISCNNGNNIEFNQYLIMSVLKAMADKDWWIGMQHRKQEIKVFVK